MAGCRLGGRHTVASRPGRNFVEPPRRSGLDGGGIYHYKIPAMLRVLLRVIAATFVFLASLTVGALANRRPCLELEQNYLQIERYASSIELNIKLFDAARLGCEDLATRLLDKGASLQARDRTGSRPLARAAAAGQADIVTLFLEKGAPIDARDLDGSTALFKAAENGRTEIVRLLVDGGANVNLPGRSEATPVAAAAFLGSKPIVQYLIEKGADLNGLDQTGKGPLVYAAGRGFPPVAKLLLDHGVDVNARYGNGLTALMWAAGHSSDAGSRDIVEVINLLVDRGARLDDQDDKGRTALMIAAELDHRAAAEALLARGADPGLKDRQGKTASDLTSLAALRAKLAAKP
jgi:uncharacterized protein